MSKIICEVCGTAYPETASQCPICGCVRPANAKGVHPTAKEAAPSGYQHVKGGRFSKSNVRKRNQGKQTAVQSKPKTNGKKDNSNTGLVITIVVLIVAILAVVAYIVLRFFVPSLPNSDKDTTADAIETTQSIETTSATIPCEDILLDVPDILFESAGETQALFASVYPENTTDTLVYASSDALVATVDDNGVITAVAPGEATITLTCGSAIVQCNVYCIFVDETTEETTDAAADFRLDRSSITFESEGESWVIYSGNLPLDEITWASDDETVAMIYNGRVTAVGNGSTYVSGQYEGVTLTCQIICRFSNDGSEGHDGNGGVSEDGGDSGSVGNNEDSKINSDNGEYQLDNLFSQYDTEVTIRVGESFPLRLVDSNGKAVEATWSVQNSSVCTVSDGDVTAVGGGQTYVIATYNGVEYRCLVRVV